MLAFNFATPNFIDLLIVGALGFGIYSGYKNGLKAPLIAVAGIISFLFALRFYPSVEYFVVGMLHVPSAFGPYVACAIVWGIAFVVLHSLIQGLDVVIKNSPNPVTKLLGSVDKALGVMWGVFKTLMIVSLIATLLGRFNFPPKMVLNGQVLYTYVQPMLGQFLDNTLVNVPLLHRFVNYFSDPSHLFDINADPKTILSPKSQDVVAPTLNPQTEITKPTGPDIRDRDMNYNNNVVLPVKEPETPNIPTVPTPQEVQPVAPTPVNPKKPRAIR
ncbi:MAG: CvpA family protein [Bacteroidia bacterium]